MSFDKFRGSPRPSLGVELELQLLDTRSLALSGAFDDVLAEVPPEFRDSVKPEYYRCCAEINTGVCGDVAEAGWDLGRKLVAVSEAARCRGILLGWGGTHPFSHWKDQPIVPTPRYLELDDHYRETLRRQLTFGLHVHVGVGDGDAAVRACNGIAEYLPAILAFSANSPFWCGRATGLRSHRVEVMGASPTSGLPPQLVDWNDYTGLVRRLTTTGLIGSAKELWWDVRPSSEYGTVEVRMCDMPLDLSWVLGLAALIQCLVVELVSRDGDGVGLDDCGMITVRQNRWLAARYGLNAPLVDVRTGRVSPARNVVKRLTQRLMRTAVSLGCARQLSCVREMADGQCGAEGQLEVFRRTGDLAAVARLLADADIGRVGLPSTADLDLGRPGIRNFTAADRRLVG
jgi:carboxylate-amine ligase